MHRYDPARQRLAIGLATLAGLVDATGFVVAGGYFTSFMSGNTTRLGVELVERPALALLPLGLIGCFLAGVVAGALMLRRVPGRHKRVLLGLVAALLGIGTGGLVAGWPLLFLAASATAMGVSNNVFTRDGEVTVGVTYMTGALVRFGQGLAARLAGQSLPATRGYGLLWSALALGAVVGGSLCLIDRSLAAGAALFSALALWGFAFRVETTPR
ncbi:YoaK family protein [Erythrobacter sp.]|uniref:YoaK family protein n=1 Tax=Erythrobacter sp. TaxID=1042 RepID=UPI0025CE5821|nr:YoaK family protein [Erythrobacter sp.]